MKVQKLGLVLGINMAAACMVMQGCKATKTGRDVPPPPSSTDGVITVVSRPAPKPAPVKPAEPADVPEQPIAVVPAQPAPSAVATVKPVPAKPAPSAVPTVKPVPAKPAPSAVATVKPVPAKPAPSAVPTVKPLPPKPPKSASAVKTAAAASAAGDEYVVKPGDTLFLISKRTNYRQSAIVAANPGLNADRLRVGQKIKLPGAAPAVAAAATTAKDAGGAKTAEGKADGKVMAASAAAPVPHAAAANTKAPVKTKSAFAAYEGPTKEYTVVSGDSLGKIALESGISIRALKALNGITKDSLRIGQKLKVPAEKQVAAPKTVAAPASKEASAKKPEADKAAAGVKDAKKKDAAAGQKPAAAEAAKDAKKPAEAVKDAKKPADAAKPAADTAKDSKKTAEAAKSAADAAKPAADAAKPAADAAKPAAEAEKPAEAAAPAAAETVAPTAGLTYKVKEGDDLVSIAIAYGISPSALMDVNDLKVTDEIKPGQVLKLPANAKAAQ